MGAFNLISLLGPKEMSFEKLVPVSEIDNRFQKNIFLIITGVFQHDPIKSLELVPGVLKQMTQPLYFLDFLKTNLETSTDPNIQILSLDCLLILVAKHSYEFDQYYTFLYDLLASELRQSPQSQPVTVFNCDATNKLIKIVEISLRSNKLNKSYMVSFIKLLLRLSLQSDERLLIWISFLVFNIFKKFA